MPDPDNIFYDWVISLTDLLLTFLNVHILKRQCLYILSRIQLLTINKGTSSQECIARLSIDTSAH